MKQRFMKLFGKRLGSIIDHKVGWLFLIVVISQLIYLFLSAFRYRLGFPLDDAWIHQTYARNFAQTGMWAFNTNEASGGSTSPLWSLLLVPGHLLPGNLFLGFTFLINWTLLFLSAIVFEKVGKKLTCLNIKFPIFGALFLLEWHFIWAANSGMETIAYIFFLLLFFNQIIQKQYGKWMGLILAGIIWIRPDGLTLFGPLLFVYIFSRNNIKTKGFLWGIAFIGISYGLYILLNAKISGSIFPNTFYAKQTEYAVLYERNILVRFWDMLKTQFVGYGILLVPGLMYQLWEKFKNKDWVWYSILLWWLGTLMLYAVRLPVFYQHGRYQIPALSIYILISIPGCINLIHKMQSYFLKLLRISWVSAGFLVMIIFVFLGADAYATDVAIIETEMVNTALWINEFTGPETVIAAHDIGALGFYGDRRIIDLAGLISPEVIPFMHDEDELIKFLNAKQPDYLMTFETWYEILPADRTLVYSSNAEFSKAVGGDSMQVYIWEP